MKLTSKVLLGVAIAVAIIPKIITLGIILGIVFWMEKVSSQDDKKLEKGGDEYEL